MNRLDTIWYLICGACALAMTAPGLALYYGGLVRRKNVLSMQIQCLCLMGLVGFCWGMWGYSLAFAPGSPWLGNLDRALLRGLHPVEGQLTAETRAELSRFLFHGGVAIFACALICGAFAERLRLTSLMLFMMLWMTLVYCPLSRWVWGGGWLEGETALLSGAADLAGGTVVHLAAGVSAMVAAIMVGQRLGYLMDDMRPHNLTYTVIGASLLWISSLFVHAGHAGLNESRAMNAIVFTNLAIASGAVTWPLIEWWQRGKASALGAASGVMAGIACAAPACGYVAPSWAALFGVTASACCYVACKLLGKIRLFDDSLDVFGVNGVAAMAGLLMTAFLATADVSGSRNGVLWGGGWRVLAGQLLAIAVTLGWAGSVSAVLFKLLDVLVGLRVSQDNEMLGLDVAQHGQEGYILNK